MAITTIFQNTQTEIPIRVFIFKIKHAAMVSNRNPKPQNVFKSKNLTCNFNAFHFQRTTKGFPSITVGWFCCDLVKHRGTKDIVRSMISVQGDETPWEKDFVRLLYRRDERFSICSNKLVLVMVSCKRRSGFSFREPPSRAPHRFKWFLSHVSYVEFFLLKKLKKMIV